MPIFFAPSGGDPLFLIAYVIAGIAGLIIYFALKRKERNASHFLGAMIYRPCNVDPLGRGRDECRGYTTGVPPSIDTEQEGGWLCPGMLGVPP